MKNTVKTAAQLLSASESFAYATILESQGSTPRGAGTGMIIRQNGEITGTVGGGALEGSVIAAAPEVCFARSAKIISFRLDGNDALTQGAVCGGSATVLIDYIDAGDQANHEFYGALLEALKQGGRFRVVTVLPGEGAARHQCLLLSDGTLKGERGIDAEVVAALHDKGVNIESTRVFLHSVGGDGTVYIFGAGHCGEKLARVLATVGFRIVVVDDRTEFASSGRFPDADEILVPDAIDAPFAGIEFGADSYIVIVTRGHRYDELVLRGALRTNAGYIGMIGSRRKRETIYRNILESGFTQADLDRVSSPIGIPIDADSPEEIAVSIAAELIKARAARRI